MRSIWETHSALRRAMGFIAPALPPGRDRQEIEIAAAQGLLSTLDPATQLLDGKMYREMTIQGEGAGVMPDVVLRPVCRDKDAAPVPASASGLLAVAADAPGETRAPEVRGPALEKPAAELTYVAQGEACGEPAAPVAGPAVDEPVRFAREVLARAASVDRARLLDAARSLAAARGR